MKRRAVVLSLLGVVLTVSLAQAAGSRIRPVGENDVVRVRVGGKLSTYHLATPDAPFEFRIEGPIPVRVLSRLLYAETPPEEAVAYELLIEIDGVRLRTLSEEARVSRGARLEDGSAIGSLKKRVVQIPRGTHTVSILPLGEDRSAALRVFRGDGRPHEINWVSYAPETYESAVRLHASDSEVVYYRLTKETPLTLTVNGPLTMKVRTRLDFDVERGHSQTYALKIHLDGELARSFPLSTRVSHTSIYPDLREITPGVARDVLFEVPNGRHEISIVLDCTTAGSASLRIFIPEKAVMNGR